MINPHKTSKSRRKFINDSTKAAAGLGLSGMISAPLISNAKHKIIGANDTIRLGLIGANSMGFVDLRNAMTEPDAECVALCDIDDQVLSRRNKDVEEEQGKKPDNYKDYRKLLEDKDIDAVIIGTPDHWHCLPFVDACKAGKDVYVEKPMGNSIGECEVMAKAARKYKRVAQIGQQQRSGIHWKEAMDLMKSGGIGQIRKVLVWSNFRYGVGRKIVPDEPVPQGVDFDMWLGPAPLRKTFNSSRFHGSWRFSWDYGGGLMTDWGVHLLDMALWVKDIKEPPISVAATGGNFSHPDHLHETFDTMSVIYQMNDFTISWEHTAGIQSGPYDRLYGVAYVGNKATLVIDRGGYEILPEITDEGRPAIDPQPEVKGQSHHHLHMRNFMDCIKSREEPNCPVENGKLVAMYAHMGNIALRTQSTLSWDNQKENFGKNKEANQLIIPEYRKPWEFPKIS